MDRNYDVIIFTLRSPRVAISADIIKVEAMFIKTIFKDSKKVKRIRNYVSKCSLYVCFLIQQNLLISAKKNANVSRTQRVCHMIHTFFGSSLGKV